MKANYLWPAMWNSAFNEDDPENPTACRRVWHRDGHTHHEPMLRAQQEWKRHGTGRVELLHECCGARDFWSKGIERNKDYESTITLGMRGDGDMPMTEGSATLRCSKRSSPTSAPSSQQNMTPDIAPEPQGLGAI